jgi:hypothetical protein
VGTLKKLGFSADSLGCRTGLKGISSKTKRLFESRFVPAQ